MIGNSRRTSNSFIIYSALSYLCSSTKNGDDGGRLEHVSLCSFGICTETEELSPLGNESLVTSCLPSWHYLAFLDFGGFLNSKQQPGKFFRTIVEGGLEVVHNITADARRILTEA